MMDDKAFYLMAASYDEDNGDYWAQLRSGGEVLRLSYNMCASPVARLVISDEEDEVLQCDIDEYAMRSYGGTWESWRLRAPIGILECHVVWSSARGEPSPLQQILGCAVPVVVSSGVLFVVRVLSLQHAPAEPPIPLQRETVPAVATVETARCNQPASVSECPALVRTHKATKPSDASFLSHYADEQLQLAGLTRHFVLRVYQIVRMAGTITSAEIARELALPKGSYRMGTALSILVQERLIYESSHNRYSTEPPNHQPADESVLLRVLGAVCDNPGMTQAGLVRATGMRSGKLCKVTRYLASEGLIRRELVAEQMGISIRGVWRHYPAQ